MQITENVLIKEPQQNLVFEDRGSIIKQSKEYKYLGVKFTQNGTLNAAIKDQKLLRKKNDSLLNCVLWKKNITKENKIRICNIVVKNNVT